MMCFMSCVVHEVVFGPAKEQMTFYYVLIEKPFQIEHCTTILSSKREV